MGLESAEELADLDARLDAAAERLWPSAGRPAGTGDPSVRSGTF